MKAQQHPRLLSDFRHHPTRQHRAVLTCDLVLDLRKGLRGDHEFYDADQIRFAVLNDDRFTIMTGQHCDLCSPAVNIFGFWLGTPSGSREALAGFAHDFLTRIRRIPCSGITRKIADDIFFDLLTEKRSRLASLYHSFVASPIGSYYMRNAEPGISCRCHS